MKIGIYNHTEGTQEVRDMTAEELAEYQATVSKIAAEKLAHKEAKAEAESALLKSLGITKDQAITLGLIQPDYVPPVFNGGN